MKTSKAWMGICVVGSIHSIIANVDFSYDNYFGLIIILIGLGMKIIDELELIHTSSRRRRKRR